MSDAHLSLVARLAPAAKVKVRRRCGTGAGPRANDGEGGADGADGDDDCAKAEEGARGLEEFFDLLKDTAPEDVRKIDARLRSQTSSEAPPALEGLGSDRIEQVWAVARTLTNVDDELLKVGVALEHLSAASCAWRRMLLATQVAGDLLRRWLWERKVKESNRGRRPDRQRRAARQAREMLAAAAMDPGLPERSVDFIAARLCDYVDENGANARGDRVAEADRDEQGGATVTFYNKDLLKAYTALASQVACSHVMARHSAEVAYRLDAEVKPRAAATEDSMARFDRAVDAAESIYPFTAAAGRMAGCKLMGYGEFRTNLRHFLAVYKEFFLLGEVKREPVDQNQRDRYQWVSEDGKVGYRICGSLQADAGERRYTHWAKHLSGLKQGKIMDRVRQSRNNRKVLEAKLKEAAEDRVNKRRKTASGPRSTTAAVVRGAKNGPGARKRKAVAATPAVAAAPAVKRARKEAVPVARPNGTEATAARGRGVAGRTRARASASAVASRCEGVAGAVGATRLRVARARGPSQTGEKSAGRDLRACVRSRADGRIAAGATVVAALSRDASAPASAAAGVVLSDGAEEGSGAAGGGGGGGGGEGGQSSVNASQKAGLECVLTVQPPKERRYFAVAMMKGTGTEGGGKPRAETMLEEVGLPDAGNHVNQYVTVEATGGFTYMDMSSLTYNLHGTHDKKTRDACLAAAEENGIACLSVPRSGSYQSRDVNVLRGGSRDLREVLLECGHGAAPEEANDLGLDVGLLLQGLERYVDSRECKAAQVNKAMSSRGNWQVTFGVSDRNFNTAAQAARSGGGVASLGPQNERILERHFSDGGQNLGEVLRKLGALRDGLVQRRGDGEREYNDPYRNHVHGSQVADMCGVGDPLPFENFTVGLTGDSTFLRQLAETCLAKLRPSERARLRNEWLGEGGCVETEDHGDGLNPWELSYSRVVLGKWPVRVAGDKEGEVLVVTVIGNHRSAVSTFESKMKSFRALDEWYVAAIEKRRVVEAREAEQERRAPPEPYDSNDREQLVTSAGCAVLLGYMPEEGKAVDGIARMKHGDGAVLAYSRKIAEHEDEDEDGDGDGGGGGSGGGGWRRHRKKSDLQDRAEAVLCADEEDGHRPEGPEGGGDDHGDDHSDGGGGRRQRERTSLDKEVSMLKAFSTVWAELRMERADHNRFADLSGCVAAAEEVRDRFGLDNGDARELALCIFWHAKSRAVFLMKCKALLSDDDGWAGKFQEAIREGDGGDGIVGNFIMECMVPSKHMNRVDTSLVRARALFHSWLDRNGEGDGDADADGDGDTDADDGGRTFTAAFVKEQAERLKRLLTDAEKLRKTKSTRNFLSEQLKKNPLQHVGQFVLPQVLPVCYLMGLVEVASFRAAEAPILDKNKEHYKKFVQLGVEPQYMDLAMLCVALKHGTTPMTVENTGCEEVRVQRDVHDFHIDGQVQYSMRPVEGCTYKDPTFRVYMKRPGRSNAWTEAVRDQNGRWRHP